MFTNSIRMTPFTTEAAEASFANRIYQGSFSGTNSGYRGDVTLVSAIRALMGNRLPEGERIAISFGYPQVSLESCSNEKIYSNIFNNMDPTGGGRLTIYDLRASRDRAVVIMDALSGSVPGHLDGWSEVKKVREWFRQSFPVCCFVNPEKKDVLIFVDRLDLRKLHCLGLAIPPVLAWYFPDASSLTPEEHRMIKSFQQTESDEFMAAIAVLAEKYDFRTARIKELLKGFETRFERGRIENLTRKNREMQDQIDSYYEQIRGLLRQMEDNGIMVAGLQAKLGDEINPEESEIMQYFLNNQNVDLIGVSDRRIDFITKGYLDVIDEDVAEGAINNNRSVLYEYTDLMPKADIKRFMKAVFLDKTLKLRTVGKYYLDLQGSAGCERGADLSEYTDRFPNPHIQGHACMNGYREAANRYLNIQNYIGALEQCVLSVRNFNWRDGIVMGTMARYLFRNDSWNRNCVELPDGSIVKPEQAVAWLKEHEHETKEEEA